MKLNEFFKKVPAIEIQSLCFDSRKVQPGALYFCLPGMTFDGHDFIKEAVEKGAVAIVHSRQLMDEQMINGAVYIRVGDVQSVMNQVAKKFYHNPSQKLWLYGITGTNGKSSIASIIQQIQNLQKPCGYIGTISISYGDTKLAPDLTTPDSLFLLSTLNDMIDSGMKACALEVSSHGLAQQRVDALDFDVAVFTNFTYDHLDFHGSMENYFQAKSLLFTQRVKPTGVSILNIDDAKGRELINLSQARTVTYGIESEADYRATDIQMSQTETSFKLIYKGQDYMVQSSLLALYNVYNLLGAIAALHQSGMPLEQILPACANIKQIEGRLEHIDEGQDFTVIVDFAHTPDGMEQIMQYGRSIANGHRLIAVFGSAGKRDVTKREVFGELADQYCDLIILTEDDPRDEDPYQIALQIKEGIQRQSPLIMVDRYEAINQAITTASTGDVILILGKGDEPYIYRENGRTPYQGDDNIARQCISARLEDE